MNKKEFFILKRNNYDNGKATPKKCDIYEVKNNNDKIEDNYVLLGSRKNMIKKKNIIEQWNFENKLFNATLDNIKKINKFENEKEDNQKIKNDSQSTFNSENNRKIHIDFNKKKFILKEIKNFYFDEDIYNLNLGPDFKIHLNNH